ncbi:MAG: hypothetical protein RLZ51_1884 [Pseudomonadota bacterium]
MAEIFDFNLAATAAAPRQISAAEAERRFMDLAASIGIDTRDLQSFGPTDDIVRVATTQDKRGKRSGWYSLHEEAGLLYGIVGNWQTGEQAKFYGREVSQIDDDLLRTMRIKQEVREREAAELKRRNAAEAAEMIRHLPPCPDSHPYLVRKRVKAHGALLVGSDLLLPLYDAAGNVVSTQTIAADGDKTFRTGCTSKGMFGIGSPTATVVVCEGFATGASIHEATGLRVYVVFSAGNLPALIGDIAEIEAVNGAQIVIAADNDLSGTGQREAEKAAEKIGGAQVLMPGEVGADWNDIAIRRPEELRKAFAEIRPLFQSWEVIDFAALPRRQWVYGHTYIRQFCSITVAPGGLGKSTLVLTEAIAMATGRNLLGVEVKEKLRVVYFNAEDPLVELQLRVAAICLRFGIDQRELVGKLFLQSGRDNEIILATGDPGELIEAAFTRIEAFVKFHGVDVVILDPLANMHESEEDNRTYRKLGKRLSRMADAYHLACHLVHHTKKLNGMAATVEDSRGGSALIGAVRVARAINPMEPDEAARFGLSTHIDHFRIEAAGKNNLARPADKAEWYVREGVPLPNGDTCAVVERWTPPDPFEGIGHEHAKRVQVELMKAEHGAWRESAQSKDWVGHLVGRICEIDPEDRAGKARIKGIIKQWITNSILAIDYVEDKVKKREVPVIVVGKELM